MLRNMRQRILALLSRFSISENTFMVTLALLIGVLAGVCNFLFRRAIEFFHWLVMEQGLELFNISFEHWSTSRFLVILFPLTGALLLIPFGIFFAKDLKFGFATFLAQVNLRGRKSLGAPSLPAVWQVRLPSEPEAVPDRRVPLLRSVVRWEVSSGRDSR